MDPTDTISALNHHDVDLLLKLGDLTHIYIYIYILARVYLIVLARPVIIMMGARVYIDARVYTGAHVNIIIHARQYNYIYIYIYIGAPV